MEKPNFKPKLIILAPPDIDLKMLGEIIVQREKENPTEEVRVIFRDEEQSGYKGFPIGIKMMDELDHYFKETKPTEPTPFVMRAMPEMKLCIIPKEKRSWSKNNRKKK